VKTDTQILYTVLYAMIIEKMYKEKTSLLLHKIYDRNKVKLDLRIKNADSVGALYTQRPHIPLVRLLTPAL
jgi:hypothetical protein